MGPAELRGVVHRRPEDVRDVGGEVDRGPDLGAQVGDGRDRGLLHEVLLVGEVVRYEALGDAGGLGDACEGGIPVSLAREHAARGPRRARREPSGVTAAAGGYGRLSGVASGPAQTAGRRRHLLTLVLLSLSEWTRRDPDIP